MVKNNLSSLRERINTLAAKTSLTKDSDNYFQLSVDNTGSGNAMLRFLPAVDGEEFPFVQLFSHAFQGPNGKWFIENCPTTLGEPCPVCEANRTLLKSNDEADKKLAAARKRKMQYVSNVAILKDQKVPANEGKVMLFKFGVRVMDKLRDLVEAPFGDDPIDPFDPEEGATFRLRVIRQNNFPDYGKSSFDAPGPLGSAEAIEALLKQRRSLTEIIAPQKFKSYDDLKEKFERIVGAAEAITTV